MEENKNEERESNMEIEQYKQQVKEEIQKYESVLEEAGTLFKSIQNRSPSPVTLTESQQSFLDESPNYEEYIETVKQFHELVTVKQLKDYQEKRAKAMYGNEIVKNALKKRFHL